MTRLDDQIVWYDKHSGRNKGCYILLRTVSIILAAFIPFAVLMAVAGWVIAGIGSAVAVIEGVEAIVQFHETWIRYRSTCEALKSEKHLFFAKAGPYSGVRNAEQYLAERVERMVARERSRWVAGRELAEDGKTTEDK